MSLDTPKTARLKLIVLVNNDVNSFLLTGSISENLTDYNSTLKVDC